MLIEFKVSNFRSIREQQTLSLVKAAGRELADTNSFPTDAPNKFELLRSAAIFGPNASGKSNLLLAVDVMRKIVMDSAMGWDPSDRLPIVPFRLDSKSARSPSEFEVSFIANGIRYLYGFTATADKVHEEWLFAYPNGRAQHWFSRTWEQTKQDYTWDIGSKLSGDVQVWRKSTRTNALFLSTAVQLNSEQLRPVYDWFSGILKVVNFEFDPIGFASLYEDSKRKRPLLSFLRAAGIDIQDIQVEYEGGGPATDMPEEMKTDAARNSKVRSIKTFRENSERRLVMPEEMKTDAARDFKMRSIKTFRENSERRLVEFDLEDESLGTRQLFCAAVLWIGVLGLGRVMFYDELRNHLHPKLVAFLVNQFHSKETNPNNAQLIFTTHETSILNQEIFRRDQIWFCEQGEDKATSVVPLTDYSPRKGRENLEAAYLTGRYGALPFVGSLKDIE